MLDWWASTKFQEWPWKGLMLSVLYLFLVWSLPCLNSVECETKENSGQQHSEQSQNIRIGCVGDKCTITRENAESEQDDTCWNGPVCLVWGAGKVYLAKIGEDPVALFTGLLFVSTLALWWATRRVWQVTNDAVQLGRKEFNVVHRPRVKVRMIQGPSIDNDHNQMAWVTVINIGDTPATVLGWGCDMNWTTKTGNWYPPGINATLKPLDPMELKTGRGHTFTVTTAIEHDPIDFLDDRIMCIVGSIRYIDDNGNFRTTGFRRTFDRISQDWIPSPDPDEEYQD